jgi:FixJ family two-component response regulator
MLYEGYIATEVAKLETRRAERSAAQRWRFRHLKSKESQVLTAIVTSVLQLFLR